jgi:hypothetical protein
MATKFRIQKDGDKFRPQYKSTFSLFWTTFDFETERGTICYESFDTKIEAEKFIERKNVDMNGSGGKPFVIKYILSLMGRQNPDEIDPLVHNFGKTIFVTHTLSTEELNKWVKMIAQDSKLRVDWSFVGGRAVIQSLGDCKKAIKSLQKFRQVHDNYFSEHLKKSNMYRDEDIKRQVEGIWNFNSISRE